MFLDPIVGLHLVGWTLLQVLGVMCQVQEAPQGQVVGLTLLQVEGDTYPATTKHRDQPHKGVVIQKLVIQSLVSLNKFIFSAIKHLRPIMQKGALSELLNKKS